jgi:hypothetical protein
VGDLCGRLDTSSLHPSPGWVTGVEATTSAKEGRRASPLHPPAAQAPEAAAGAVGAAELDANTPTDEPGNSGTTSTDEGDEGQQCSWSARTGDGDWGSNVEPESGPGAGASDSGATAEFWRGVLSRASGGHGEEDGSRTLERGTGAAAPGGGARTATLAAKELFLTINRPRTVGSALREARTAAASTAAEGGVTREAAVASMGKLDRSSRGGSTAAPADRAPYMLHGGMRRGRREEAGSSLGGRRG